MTGISPSVLSETYVPVSVGHGEADLVTGGEFELTDGDGELPLKGDFGGIGKGPDFRLNASKIEELVVEMLLIVPSIGDSGITN